MGAKGFCRLDSGQIILNTNELSDKISALEQSLKNISLTEKLKGKSSIEIRDEICRVHEKIDLMDMYLDAKYTNNAERLKKLENKAYLMESIRGPERFRYIEKELTNKEFSKEEFSERVSELVDNRHDALTNTDRSKKLLVHEKEKILKACIHDRKIYLSEQAGSPLVF